MIKRNYKSFALIELLAAVAILSIGLTAGLLFTSHYLQMMTYNKNKIIAVYLAGRQLELLRWQRDTNFFQNQTWNQGFDLLQSTLQPICLDGDTYIYTCPETSKPTVFERKMDLNYEGGNNWVTAISLIKWDQGEVKLTETLYNWK